MAFGERCLLALVMAFDAKFPSCLFTLYLMEFAMNIVMGKKGGGFIGCIE